MSKLITSLYRQIEASNLQSAAGMRISPAGAGCDDGEVHIRFWSERDAKRATEVLGANWDVRRSPLDSSFRVFRPLSHDERIGLITEALLVEFGPKPFDDDCHDFFVDLLQRYSFIPENLPASDAEWENVVLMPYDQVVQKVQALIDSETTTKERPK